MTTKNPDAQKNALAKLLKFDQDNLIYASDHILSDEMQTKVQTMRSNLCMAAVGADAEEILKWSAKDLNQMFLSATIVQIKAMLALASDAKVYYFISWKKEHLTSELQKNLESEGFVCEFVQEVQKDEAVLDQKYRFCEKSAATHLRVSF